MSILFQCTECRRLETATRARVSAENVWLSCPSCGQSSALVREDAGDAKDSALGPSPVPEDSPVAEVLSELDLERDVASVETPELTAPLALANFEDDSPVATKFSELLSKWSDESAHDKIIELAAQTDQLAALGQRYRAVLDERPEDPQAKRAQQRILASAMATMTPSSKTTSNVNVRLIGIAFVGVMIVAGLLFFWTRYMNPALNGQG